MSDSDPASPPAPDAPARINARLDGEAQAQLSYLVRATGQSVSHVVREAVAQYHAQVKARQGGLRHFAQAIGAGDSGRSDISTRYKELLAESLAAKHGLKPAAPAADAPLAVAGQTSAEPERFGKADAGLVRDSKTGAEPARDGKADA